MGSESKLLKPVFFAAWACVSLFAVWHSRVRASDSSSALIAGLLLIASLAFSRYVLDLPFTSGPLLYLSLLGLFHLGLIVPWALGLYDISRAPWFMPYGLSPAITLIIYAIVAYQLGILGAFAAGTFKPGSPVATDAATDNSEVFVAGGLLFIFGMAMFVAGFIGLDPRHYLQIIYSDIYRLDAESDPRLFGAGMMLALMGLNIASAGASKKRFRAIFIGAGVWVMALFYLGFRGAALIAALIVYTIALKKGVRFPRWFPWLATAGLLVAIPAMQFARQEPLDRRIFDLAPHNFNLLDAPTEMGASIQPLIETMSLVGPTNYRHGRTYWTAIKDIVPNLAARWQPSATESMEDLPPGDWITAMVDPWAHDHYGGIGFSAIAEPYMNFGGAGVVVYFLLLGFLIVRLEQASIRSAYALASWALVLGPLLGTARNDSSNFFRPVAWGLLFLGATRVFWGGYSLLSRFRQRDALVSAQISENEGA